MIRAKSPHLDSETLHEQLLAALPGLREHVARKIPQRLRAWIDADDVLQEVWTDAYRGIKTFDPRVPDAVERWLKRIANSKLHDAIRAARAVKRGGNRQHVNNAKNHFTSFVDLFAKIQADCRTPSREFAAIESGHAVAMALNVLPHGQRVAVYMRHIEGRSHRDIAMLLGVTEASVNSLIYNGLRALRSILGDSARFFSDVRSAEVDAPPTKAKA